MPQLFDCEGLTFVLLLTISFLENCITHFHFYVLFRVIILSILSIKILLHLQTTPSNPISARLVNNHNTQSMDSKTTIQAAKFATITSNLIMTGYTLALSQNGASQLYDEPARFSTPMFKRIFNTGGRFAIPSSLLNTFSSVYLAYFVPEKRRLWALVTALTVAMNLWTGFIMMPGIQRLIAISESSAAQEKADANLEHRQLLIKWVKQNYVRALAMMVGGLAGLQACTE